MEALLRRVPGSGLGSSTHAREKASGDPCTFAELPWVRGVGAGVGGIWCQTTGRHTDEQGILGRTWNKANNRPINTWREYDRNSD